MKHRKPRPVPTDVFYRVQYVEDTRQAWGYCVTIKVFDIPHTVIGTYSSYEQGEARAVRHFDKNYGDMTPRPKRHVERVPRPA